MNANDDGEDTDLTDAISWLEWTRDMLDARRMYHKKRTVKLGMIKKMAETLLSADELERIDAEVESRLE